MGYYMVNIPDTLKYTETHEWVRIEGDIATIGITDFAQEQLGDIVFVDLPDVGRVVAQHEEIGSIESAKAVGEFNVPISGEIVEKNDALNDAPETVNKSPYDEGWMIKVKMSKPTEVNSLLDAAQYSSKAK
jgi:glycine cleavage system H protein